MANIKEFYNMDNSIKETSTNHLETFKQFLQTNLEDKPDNLNFSCQYQLPVGPQGTKVLVKYCDWLILKVNLSVYKILDQGMQAIINDSKWPSLQALYLNKNNITSDGLINIDKCNWKDLTVLTLDQNKISHEGILSLTKCDWPNLKTLKIAQNIIGQQGALHISKANWPKLEILNISYCLIGNKGLRHLIKGNFPKMKKIYLANNKLSADGMYYLKIANWTQLEGINLNRNTVGKINSKMSDIGCTYLSQLKSHKIKQFSIFGNDITLNGIKLILRSSRLVENCFMELIKNQFTFNQIEEDLKQMKRFCNKFES